MLQPDSMAPHEGLGLRAGFSAGHAVCVRLSMLTHGSLQAGFNGACALMSTVQMLTDGGQLTWRPPSRACQDGTNWWVVLMPIASMASGYKTYTRSQKAPS